MQYDNIHHIDFKSTSEIYFPGLSRKTKILDYSDFFDIIHCTGSLEGTFTANVSLVLLTKVHAH